MQPSPQNKFDAAFERACQALAAFKAEFGHCEVPQSYKTADGFSLGKWCSKQRTKNLSYPPCPPERRQALEAMGFNFSGRLGGGLSPAIAAVKSGAPQTYGNTPKQEATLLWPAQRNRKERFKSALLALSGFKTEFGHCNVLQTYKTADGFLLGVWCSRQRTKATRPGYPPERRQALEAMGFDFGNRHLGPPFERGLRALCAFKAEFGHCNVTYAYKTADGYPLGAWCISQRYTAKRPDYLPERRQALEAIGFDFGDQRDARFERAALKAMGFDIGNSRSPTKRRYVQSKRQALGGARFERACQALAAFKAEFGHCDVLKKHITADGFLLGVWCSTQRYAAKRPDYPPERRQALEELGFDFSDRQGAKFERGLQALCAFKAELGHCDVPQIYKTADGFSLGKWCSTQRYAAKRPDYPPERRQALEAMGFEFRSLIRRESFEYGCDALAAFKAELGHCDVPQIYKTADGFSLGKWCSTQRYAAKRPDYPPERRQALEAMGFEFRSLIRRESFEYGCDALAAFKAEFGHCNVPKMYKTADGYRLGSWTANQIWAIQNGHLDEDRARRLMALGLGTDEPPASDERGGDDEDEPVRPRMRGG